MCGLVGLAGNFQKELLFSMMESLKHRGEDSSGFYLYDGEDCCLCNDFDLFSDWKIEFPDYGLNEESEGNSSANAVSSDG